MAIKVNTTQKVIPMIYAYTTPEIAAHDGWTKIGYTEQDVTERIKQQTHTADVKAKEEWRGSATFDDGTGDTFTDHEFHAYLRKNDIEQEKGKNNEWFKVTGLESKIMFYDFRSNRGIMGSDIPVIPYTLREEQSEAVAMTKKYKETHGDNAEFLWNAKPRFGKTLSVYDFCKEINAKKVLIVTNRPAIANSWFSDYAHFIGVENNYYFVSEVDALKNVKGVLTRDEYMKKLIAAPEGEEPGIIEFVSLQDMKGSIYFGGKFDKLKELSDKSGMVWDILVIDEAHEGVDTYKTDTAFDHVLRKFTLHLSGTPFKALASDKFKDDAIYNWTYADEQTKKTTWEELHPSEDNPYANLPKLNLFTYQMSEIVHEEIKQGIEINGETEEFAFDLNEFFRVSGGNFVYDKAVTLFLDALTTQEKFPFSTPELRDELNHTFWLLNRVDSAKALAKKLANHPVFKDYEVVLAAGDGQLDEDEEAKESEKSFNKVKKAIKEHEKTITLSVGQLTTGITVPEWTAVLMLSNIKSPSLYMQAAFRAQNPCLFHIGTEYRRKENAYVFDFDPARTLTTYEQFANDLSADTTSGKGDVEKRKAHIKTLLNFFPVIGEDDEGKMVELDAEKVLAIPRKIKSQEVVKRGFMSNFLFQNISNIFGAPQAVIDIIQAFTPVDEPKNKTTVTTDTKEQLSIDDNGEVNVTEEIAIGIANDIFGEKIYDISETIINTINEVKNEQSDENALLETLKEKFKTEVVTPIVSTAKENYGDNLKVSDEKAITKTLEKTSEKELTKAVNEFKITNNTLEAEKSDALKDRFNSGKTEEQINKEFEQKKKDAAEKLQNDLKGIAENFTKEAAKDVVKTVETKIKEREKDSVENSVRDHLRGFSRTIPSFLMAYGDETVTLATFDQKVPDKVFIEVTSITLDQFKFLRDGGDYTDEETGEQKHFDGQLFDAVVFDDSVKEFLRLKKKLANYFDENAIEDIFDYIPPQKTNQIFTPKDVVKKMVDMLEEENPGCFDNPDKTFIDMYMKSGLYITEIVKRLFNSEKMKEKFPDDKERLRYIFEHQVYGLAPTEIIYNIAKSYILGFSDEIPIEKHNLRQFDALPFAKDGTLSEKLDELFGES